MQKTGMVKAEIEFASQMDQQGKTWFFEPRSFRLAKSPYTYTPDFFVVEDKCFYEILGSRQAYSYQRHGIEAFLEQYPNLRLEIVNAGAWLNGPRPARVRRVKQPNTIYAQHGAVRKLKRKAELLSPIMRELLEAMTDLRCRTIKEFCVLIGISPRTVYGIIHDKNKKSGTQTIWRVRARCAELLKEAP